MDIDECQDEQLYECHGNATCINEPGTYQCKCLEVLGYRGNGSTCTGKFNQHFIVHVGFYDYFSD